MKKIIIVVLLLCGIPLSCFSHQQPRSLALDHRVKVVTYHAQDVVNLVGHPLIDTEIQLNPSEKILDIHVGDPLAWVVDMNKSLPYIFFVKPKLLESDTNMIVITNQRVYHFNLHTTPQKTSTDRNIIYALNFEYPEEVIVSSTYGVKDRFSKISFPSYLPMNLNYTFRGSKTIAPIQAFDDGTFTVFKFPKHRIIPAIFSVDNHQHEALVNFRMQGDEVWIQGTHEKYRLRNGLEVTTVYNEHFLL